MSQLLSSYVTFGRVRASDVGMGRTKGLVWILLAVFCAGSFTHAQGITLVAPEAPAGCHSHGHVPKSPSQQPVSYACCAAGHGSALVLSAYLPGLVLLGPVGSGPRPQASSFKPLNTAHCLFANTSAPPGGSPLRV